MRFANAYSLIASLGTVNNPYSIKGINKDSKVLFLQSITYPAGPTTLPNNFVPYLMSVTLYATITIAEYTANADLAKPVVDLSFNVYYSKAPTKICTYKWETTTKTFVSNCSSDPA